MVTVEYRIGGAHFFNGIDPHIYIGVGKCFGVGGWGATSSS